jgi:hypothetical protein
VGVYGMLGVETDQGANGADQSFGGLPVGNDIAGEHGVEQLRELAVEDPVQRRMHGPVHQQNRPTCGEDNSLRMKAATCCAARARRAGPVTPPGRGVAGPDHLARVLIDRHARKPDILGSTML